MKRCKHNKTWLIAGGNYEWCYECGAIRVLRRTGVCECTPVSPWCTPVGRGNGNPWNKWDKRRNAYMKKKGLAV